MLSSFYKDMNFILIEAREKLNKTIKVNQNAIVTSENTSQKPDLSTERKFYYVYKKWIQKLSTQLKTLSKNIEKSYMQLAKNLNNISNIHSSSIKKFTKQLSDLTTTTALQSCDLLSSPAGKMANTIIIDFAGATLCKHGICIPTQELLNIQKILCNIMKLHNEFNQKITKDLENKIIYSGCVKGKDTKEKLRRRPINRKKTNAKKSSPRKRLST